jgi:hypothetical protein
MTTICSHSGLDVTCVATREPRISILRLDITSVPDDFETAMVAIRAFLDTSSGRIVTHAHVASDTTPGMSQTMSLVRHLLELQTVMDAKLKGTIIQVGRRTECMDLSLCLLNKMYTPTSARGMRRVFEVVDTDEHADRIMEDILSHEATKRARCESSREK